MKQIFKKLLGIDKIEEQVVEATRIKLEAESSAKASLIAAEEAKETERLSKLSPKELATEQKEPWITVLETHINKENVRNGFFELDWNEYFVLKLRNAGYQGNTDEAIVDAWFSELCRNIGRETGIDMSKRGSGYVNRALRDDGLSEIG